MAKQENRPAVKDSFDRLYGIIKRLRGPGGCAWDREQSPETLRGSLIEETYECISAIDDSDEENLREELGDLYLLITMIGRMKEEEGSFNLDEVLQDICSKLIRRHPHVFGNSKKSDVSEILEQWEAIKEHVEGRKSESVLEKVSKALPPLERAYHIQKRVSRVGFDWEHTAPVWDKLHEEIDELKAAMSSGSKRETEEEFGDLLFTVINLCRLTKIDPSLALHRTNRKFVSRFRELERRIARQNLKLQDLSLEEMDTVWDQIKREGKGENQKE